MGLYVRVIAAIYDIYDMIMNTVKTSCLARKRFFLCSLSILFFYDKIYELVKITLSAKHRSPVADVAF